MFLFFVLRRFQSKSSYLSQNKTQEKCNVFLILKKPEPFLWRVQVLHLILAQELNWKHKRKISFMEVSPAKKSSCPSCISSALRNCICPFSRANMGSSYYVLGGSHFVSIWGWVNVSVPTVKESSQTTVRSDPLMHCHSWLLVTIWWGQPLSWAPSSVIKIVLSMEPHRKHCWGSQPAWTPGMWKTHSFVQFELKIWASLRNCPVLSTGYLCFLESRQAPQLFLKTISYSIDELNILPYIMILLSLEIWNIQFQLQ